MALRYVVSKCIMWLLWQAFLFFFSQFASSVFLGIFIFFIKLVFFNMAKNTAPPSEISREVSVFSTSFSDKSGKRQARIFS